VKYIINIFKGLFKHYLSLFLSIGKDTILVRALAKNGSFGFTHGNIVFYAVRECFTFAEGSAKKNFRLKAII